jgi:hypothetical protein
MPTCQWIQDKEAAALLASCAAIPPDRRVFNYSFGDTDERFYGKRVVRLNAIRKRYLEEALAFDDKTGLRTFGGEAGLTVEQAIADVLEAKRGSIAA